MVWRSGVGLFVSTMQQCKISFSLIFCGWGVVLLLCNWMFILPSWTIRKRLHFSSSFVLSNVAPHLMEASHLACTLPTVAFFWRLTPLTGFDRMMAMLCGTQSIRDVIAFPKTGSGIDPLFRSPAIVSNETLLQYGIQSTNPDAGN